MGRKTWESIGKYDVYTIDSEKWSYTLTINKSKIIKEIWKFICQESPFTFNPVANITSFFQGLLDFFPNLFFEIAHMSP